MTPEIADSIGYGTKIWFVKVSPMGTAALVAVGSNCQMPLRFSQLLRAICGRGYSGSGALVLIIYAHGVINGACFICHAFALMPGLKAKMQSAENVQIIALFAFDMVTHLASQ